ncbi:WG repeat-containing protein [Sediminibacterium sp.]|uniref:WG repeat-containing protein n=1 Tax=Sediminibacterium sp. TaxID=1917865 RepID=UPI0027361B23|nr:WG repeat-containing protein [Sediminibacterium sp.]MDP3392712.1 WG repeat-containing protein [Sediminibacterium sp.]MDP3566045.1 WG repeat-containing protein [Sediminibacterium sp.]
MRSLLLFVLFGMFFSSIVAQSITVVKESFDDNRFGISSNTQLTKKDSVLYFIDKGSFQMNNKFYLGSSTRWVTHTYGMSAKANTRYQADFFQISGSQSYGYGIVTHAVDGKNFVLFVVAANGYYLINVASNGKLNNVSNGWVKSTLVKTGYNTINQLAVEMDGDNFNFILNDVSVKQTRLPGQSNGYNMGLVSHGGMHVAMDNLQIQQWLPNKMIPGKIEPGYTPMTKYPLALKPIPTKSKQPELFGITEGQYGFKYGLVDKDGFRFVDPLFRYADIIENRIVVNEENSAFSGVYDLLGNTIVPPIMKTIGFKKDKEVIYFSCKSENGYWGLIDQSGKTILPFVYNYLDKVSEGLIYAKNGKGWGVIDLNGSAVVPFGTIDDEDEVKKRKNRYPVLYKKGRIIVKAKLSDGDQIGVMDNYGKWVIPPRFHSISLIDTNQAYKVAIIDPVDKTKIKYGIIDYYGKEIIPFKYSSISLEGKNYTVAEGDDPDGFDLVDLSDDELWEALGAEEQTDSRKWGMLNNTGAIIIPIKHSYISSTGDKQMVLVEDEIKDSNSKQTKIIKTLYDLMGKSWLSLSSYDSYKYDSLLFKGKPKGDYRTAYPYYSHGLINVAKAGKWGFVDKTGKVVMPFQFDHASAFYNGAALVKKGNEWWYINKQGKKISEAEANPKKGINYSNKELPPLRAIK